MYYRASYYNPAIGRFISEDPIGFDGQDTNLYRYVLNNPIRYNDPSGKIPFGVPILLGVLIVQLSEGLSDSTLPLPPDDLKYPEPVLKLPHPNPNEIPSNLDELFDDFSSECISNPASCKRKKNREENKKVKQRCG